MISVRDDLQALEGYHSPQVDVSVRLNTNESPLPPPPAFTDALLAELSRVEWHRYPDRHVHDLRAAIADFHQVAPDMVFVANGSNEVLQTLLLTYAGHGRRVATFEPTYQMHAQIARTVGSTVVSGERSDDFTLDAAELRRVIADHDPHVVFITSPNNPTGLVEPADRVAELLTLSNGLVIADEAYAQFADWTALDLLADDRPLVVTRTFSKTWGMAGARLGYAIGPPSLIAELDKVVLPYHLDIAKQVAGQVALRFVDEMNERVDFIVAERERLGREMRSLGADVVPSGANFILFRPTSLGGDELWQRLLDDDILVRNCSGWPGLTDCLRVTVGTSAENDRFLDSLTHHLSNAPAARPQRPFATQRPATLGDDAQRTSGAAAAVPTHTPSPEESS